MKLQKFDVPSVRVLGRTSEFTEAMVESVRRLAPPAVEGRVPRVDSLILVLDLDHPESPLAERHSCRSRLRQRAYQNAACSLTVGTALDTGARRVVVVCDGRRLTFGQRIRVAGTVRRLTRRIAYECEINGARSLPASYAVVDVDDDIARVAAAAVRGRSQHRRAPFPKRARAA